MPIFNDWFNGNYSVIVKFSVSRLNFNVYVKIQDLMLRI